MSINMENCVLKLDGLSKSFPGVKALDNVSFSLGEGEVLALIGENGAGKSTLIKCLTGAYAPSAGTLNVFGKTYTHISPNEARSIGISAVYQEFNLIPILSVVENIFVGNLPGNGMTVNEEEMRKRAQDIFDDFEVKINLTEKLSNLSPAMMQIVEIAKAIELNCRILILDEPTAPLTTKETEILFRIIRKSKEQGISIIYISHRLEEIFEICDRVVVLKDGAYVDQRLIKDTNRLELIRLMIGYDLSDYYPENKREINPEKVLEVRNLNGNGCKDISFDLHKGEILGFAGLVGAGRTELMSVIFGDKKKDSGEIIVNGEPFHGKTPWSAVKKGLCLLPEDRKSNGLLLDMSVSMNITIASIKQFCRFGIINSAKEKEAVKLYCDKLKVKTPNYQQQAQFLSGGNQQKLIIARWVLSGCKIILFDEPTRGIDVGARREIYDLIQELTEDGFSIICVSSDFDELIGLADRIAVMAEGELMEILEPNDFSKERMLDLASGRR